MPEHVWSVWNCFQMSFKYIWSTIQEFIIQSFSLPSYHAAACSHSELSNYFAYLLCVAWICINTDKWTFKHIFSCKSSHVSALRERLQRINSKKIFHRLRNCQRTRRNGSQNIYMTILTNYNATEATAVMHAIQFNLSFCIKLNKQIFK